MGSNGRSLVMVSKQRSIGGIKTYRIHNQLYEFCVTKAKEESFLQPICEYDQQYTLNVLHYLRRLCINVKRKHFLKSKLFSPIIHCLLFFTQDEEQSRVSYDLSFIFRIFKLVRVLDLSQTSLRHDFPREIKMLVHLRYLAVLVRIQIIPSSIANLSNLETLSWKHSIQQFYFQMLYGI